MLSRKNGYPSKCELWNAHITEACSYLLRTLKENKSWRRRTLRPNRRVFEVNLQGGTRLNSTFPSHRTASKLLDAGEPLEALHQDGEGTAWEKLDNDFIWLTNERFQKINDKDGNTVAIFELTYGAIESPSLELVRRNN